jgi:hypothetical protein
MRLTFDIVKAEVERRGDGYRLLEFTKSTEKMKMLCPEGHEFKMNISNFRKGQKCSKCVGGVKLSYEHIKNHMEGEGYTLLSKSYKNNITKLDVVCPNGHSIKMCWADFKKGSKCYVCNGGVRLTYSYIKEHIESEGYELLSKTYKNSSSKIVLKCPLGHTYESTWNSFQQGVRCSVCFKNVAPTIDYITSFAKERGYIVEHCNYKNSKSKITFKCPFGHTFKMCWNNFQQGQKCSTCARNKTTSKAEKEILEIVSRYCDVVPNDRTQIVNPLTNCNLELDIWIPSLRRAIEFNGEYWHSSSYSKWKDQQKKQQCKTNNIDLLVIEERQWYNNKYETLNTIMDFLKQ